MPPMKRRSAEMRMLTKLLSVAAAGALVLGAGIVEAKPAFEPGHVSPVQG